MLAVRECLFVAMLAAPAPARAEGYAVKLEPAAVDVEVGSAGSVSFAIVPEPEYSIDRDGPLRIRLAVEPAEGIELPRTRYRRAHAADAQADAPRFDLRYKAVSAGKYVLSIDARFWVCRRYTCRAARERHTVAIRVRPPPPSPDAAPAP